MRGGSTRGLTRFAEKSKHFPCQLLGASLARAGIFFARILTAIRVTVMMGKNRA